MAGLAANQVPSFHPESSQINEYSEESILSCVGPRILEVAMPRTTVLLHLQSRPLMSTTTNPSPPQQQFNIRFGALPSELLIPILTLAISVESEFSPAYDVRALRFGRTSLRTYLKDSFNSSCEDPGRRSCTLTWSMVTVRKTSEAGRANLHRNWRSSSTTPIGFDISP